jgi:saccharopine dehydrogenase-like NADP-dependent oxidoreductase
MKALIVGVGGVGESMATLAARRDPGGEIFERMVLADYDKARAERVSQRLGAERFPAVQVDAFDADGVAALARTHAVDVICNFLPMTANLALLDAALKAGVHYLDTAICEDPTPAETGRKREFWDSPQFDYHDRFAAAGKLALTGFGVEPGMADFFARYAADHFFDEIDEIGVRDGANLEIPGFKGMAFGFSVWATIDECTCDAIVWEAGKGWHRVPAFSDMEPFVLPGGIGEQMVGNVAHDEVVHIGRNAHLLKGVKKATFKYALGDEFMHGVDVLKSLNLHSSEPVLVKGHPVAPIDLVCAAAPDPAETGKAFVGKTAAGTWVKGRRDGLERELYLYQVADNQQTVATYGTQAVVCQTAFTPAIALELLATGKLAGYRGNPKSGMGAPEQFCADPYVALMATYGFPGGITEMDSEYKRAQESATLTAPLAQD